jgi:predicted MFS family arabinose efflux permease
MPRDSRGYELRMVAILCVAFGILTTEIFGIGFLAPFIARDLALSNVQMGTLFSGFWVTYSISSYLAGFITDRWGKRKPVLLASLILVSVFSVLSSFATSFYTLLAARMLMGSVVGLFLPVAQTVIALESPSRRLGLYTGLLQSLGNNLLAVFLAPSIIVYIAVHYGWRAGFLVVIGPGLMCSILVAWLIREPSSRPAGTQFDQNSQRDANAQPDGASARGGARKSEASRGVSHMFRGRNIWLCMAGSSLLLAFITITMGFLPKFFVDVRGLAPESMSALMSVLGIAGAILGVGLPALSDRLGRRPVMMLACALGVIAPLSAIFYSGPMVMAGVLLFLGWAAAGVTPLFLAIVPSESVPKESLSTVIGLNIAVGTLIGGVGGPAFAGWAADQWGLHASLGIDVACAASAALLALFIRETAPRALGR